MSTPQVAGRSTETITDPGVYDELPAQVYHADPVPGGSLSVSGAKTLLPPSCPALFDWERRHRRPDRRVFDLGHAAHRYVLGVGAELAVVDAENWRTRAAQHQRDEAYAAGKTPLLTHEHDTVQAMAVSLRDHPIASLLFAEGSGRAEQSLFWKESEFGIWRRARVDWLPNEARGERMIVADYKTTTSAAPTDLESSMYRRGYHQQAVWYADGIRALGLASDVAFLFILQEKTPPYLVTVAEPSADALRAGRELNRHAMRIYRDCTQTGYWPSYSHGIEQIGLPRSLEFHYYDNGVLT